MSLVQRAVWSLHSPKCRVWIYIDLERTVLNIVAERNPLNNMQLSPPNSIAAPAGGSAFSYSRISSQLSAGFFSLGLHMYVTVCPYVGLSKSPIPKMCAVLSHPNKKRFFYFFKLHFFRIIQQSSANSNFKPTFIFYVF